MKKLFLLFPMFLATTFAQDVYIYPKLAQQGYIPLDPTAVDHPVITSKTISKGSVLSQFTVTNYSSKPVTSIEYGWRVSAASACSGSAGALGDVHGRGPDRPRWRGSNCSSGCTQSSGIGQGTGSRGPCQQNFGGSGDAWHR